MDAYESQEAERRLAFLELLLTAQERRHEVVDAVWDSADRDEAAERLRSLLDIPDDVPPQLVLDLQVARLARDQRDAIAGEVARLRNLVDEERS